MDFGAPLRRDLRQRLVRIGAWNLDAGWSAAHAEALVDMDCDVHLLTEVRPSVELTGYELHLTTSVMARGQAWAGVATRVPCRMLPEPHPASVAVDVRDLVMCSSILPWSGCGGVEPWRGDSVGERTAHAVNAIRATLPIGQCVWGGDWNHTLVGGHASTSKRGREVILGALDELELACPTKHLPHRLTGVTSIDHIAVPRTAAATKAEHVPTDPKLSDHDAYVVDVEFR